MWIRSGTPKDVELSVPCSKGGAATQRFNELTCLAGDKTLSVSAESQ